MEKYGSLDWTLNEALRQFIPAAEDGGVFLPKEYKQPMTDWNNMPEGSYEEQIYRDLVAVYVTHDLSLSDFDASYQAVLKESYRFGGYSFPLASALMSSSSSSSSASLSSASLSSHSSASSSSSFIEMELPTVTTDSYVNHNPSNADINGTVVSEGGTSVTERGAVWATSPNPTISDHKVAAIGGGAGSFELNISGIGYSTVYVRAYATNTAGTAYGSDVSFVPELCLAKGTRIQLSDGSHKNIEDISYDDKLLVWNFDDGKFDTACPVWVKQEATTDRYNLLTFSDGSQLKTINQHRIFNKQAGAFTWPMTDDTPLGSTSFSASGEEVTLVSKEVIHEEVQYYNVITDSHFNLFANGILTSCRLNNLYPIENMKFVKSTRQDRPRKEFSEISDRFYYGLRLWEQTTDAGELYSYVYRLEKIEQMVMVDAER